MSDATPAGGIREIAIWTDTDGNRCPPEEAVHAEIVEYDADGLEIARTYMEPLEPDNPVVAEEAPINYDDYPINPWDPPKQWDIRDPETQQLVEDLETLQRALTFDAHTDYGRQYLGQLMLLGVWVNAPQALKDEVHAFLESTRPE